MDIRWSGSANHPGPAMLVIANGAPLITVWHILAFLAGLLAICVFGSLLWQIWDYGVRQRRPGQSPEQFLQANEQLGAEQLRKAAEEWRLPPELSLPTPRPVKSGRPGTRLLQSVPFLLLLMFLGLITWHTTWRLWPSRSAWAPLALDWILHASEGTEVAQVGKPARAVVTSVSMGGGAGAWNLEYHDSAGNLIKGSLSRGSPPKTPVLTVLYDPDMPHRFTPYPVVRYQIVAPESS